MKEQSSESLKEQSKGVTTTEVIILGSDISGLFLALQLIRFGVYPKVLDQNCSKKFAQKKEFPVLLNLHAIQAFEQIGLGEEIKKGAVKISAWKFYDRKNTSQNLHSPSEKGPQLLIKYGDLHQILLHALTEKACSVLWNYTGLQVKTRPHDVHLQVHSEGISQVFLGKYLVATTPFTSGDFSENFLKPGSQYLYEVDNTVVYDLLPKMKEETETLHVFENNSSVNAIIPSYHVGKYFVFLKGGTDLLNEFEAYALKDSRYRKIQKSSYSRGFQSGLAVDKRVLHMAEGAYSVDFLQLLVHNLYFYDLLNLSWKLARALRFKGMDPILQTYLEERGPYQQQFLQRDLHEIMQVFYGKKGSARMLDVFKRLNPFSFSADSSRKNHLPEKFWARINQLDNSYKYSSISINHSYMEIVESGDRVPNFEIYDEKAKEFIYLHDSLHKANFTLLIVGTIGAHNLWALGKWVQQTFPQHLNVIYVPYSQKNLSVFKRLNLNEDQQLLMILRPDKHIAYMSNSIQVHLISNYLLSVIGNRNLEIPF